MFLYTSSAHEVTQLSVLCLYS